MSRTTKIFKLSEQIAIETQLTSIEVMELMSVYNRLCKSDEELESMVRNHIHQELNKESVRSVINE